jgi:uncharacterized membrane-anchored protein
MNSDDSRDTALEARLRHLLGGLDAAAGFDERVIRRVADLAAARGVPREDLRAQFERRRERVRLRLRREAWMNGITIVALGVCAGGLVWRYAGEIQSLASNAAWPVDPNVVITGTVAAVGAALWMLIKRARSAR